MPPSAQSPFARSRHYLLRRHVSHRVSGRYPAFVAPTDSCASPCPSHRLWPRPRSTGLCRSLSDPAATGTFPTLSLRILPRVLGPLPRLLSWCIRPLLLTRHRPSRSFDAVGAQLSPYTCDFRTVSLSRLQSFRYVQARGLARHPDRSYRNTSRCRAAVTYYVHAYLSSLPPRAVDMLAVRFGQLTAGGLAPPKIRSLVDCSQKT